MINVVGAGEDPENLTPPTFYSFTPKQKQAPAPVKPIAQVPQAAPVAIPVAEPATTPIVTEPPMAVPLEPDPVDAPPVIAESTAHPQPTHKTKNLLIIGVIGLLILIGGISAAVFLGQTNQDVRQQASTIEDEMPIAPTTALEPTIELEPTTEPEPTQPILDEVETLALAPTLSPTPTSTTTPVPVVTPSPTLINTTDFCGQSCVTDENCQNPAHTCSSGSCKLGSNPISASCKTPSGSTQIQWDDTQPSREYSPYAELSGETPQSGPEDWLRYGWLGIGVLGIGATLLLFL